jgi:hypothetical protein
MKKLAVTLCLSAFAVSAFAQGTVNYLNSPTTLVSTNGLAAGRTAGATSPSAGGQYYYALFIAPTTITSATVGDLSTAAWTFTGLYANTTAATTGGRFSGGGGVSAQGWLPGVSQSYAILGWSAGLGGTNSMTSLLATIGNPTFAGGAWTGGGALDSFNGQYFGLSSVGFGSAGGGASGLPAFGLFGAPSGQGTPINTGFNLWVVNIPEPSTFALAGLGAAALVIFRRRKA